uniref:Uncharacterized protein n=1 Tax=Anguilla anguilla TaxID=7936 RepID=A0A0E9UU21_ANGAN
MSTTISLLIFLTYFCLFMVMEGILHVLFT